MFQYCCKRGSHCVYTGRNARPDLASYQKRCLKTELPISIARKYDRGSILGRQVHCRDSLFQSAWGTAVDAQTLSEVVAPQLFAVSLFPYLGFLYHLTKGQEWSGAPRLMVFGFYFLLVFVFATIPAGIYAKTVYKTSLANVDWAHGASEVLLTFTNLFIGASLVSKFLFSYDMFGIRQGIMESQRSDDKNPESSSTATEDTASKR